MSLLGLVKQPTGNDSMVIALWRFTLLVGVFALEVTNLHDYGDTGIVENLWSKVGMPESLSFVPGERGEHRDGRGSSFGG